MSEEEVTGGLTDRDLAMAERRGFEAKENQMGTSQVESLLGGLRDRDNERRKLVESGPNKPQEPDAIFDLRDFFRATLDDAKKRNAKAQECRNLEEMQDSVIKLTADEKLSTTERDQVIEYITKEMDDWRKQALLPSLSDEERKTAEGNQRIFGTFRNTIYNRTDSDRDIVEAGIEKGIKTAETIANTHTVDEEDDLTIKLNPPEDFKNTTIKPDAAKASLKEIAKAKPKELSYAHFYSFYDDLGQDITAKEEAYKAKHPTWEAKGPVVLAADTFKNENKAKAKDQGIMIYVTVKTDGSVNHVGWKPEAENEPGSRYYTFDPNAPMDDENSLSRHVRNVNQFDDQRAFVKDVKAIMKKVERGEEITFQERLHLTQVDENYVTAEKYEKAREHMSKFIDANAKVNFDTMRK